MRIHVNFLTHLARELQIAVDKTSMGDVPQLAITVPKEVVDADGRSFPYQQLLFEPGHDETHGWIVTIPDVDFAANAEAVDRVRSAK